MITKLAFVGDNFLGLTIFEKNLGSYKSIEEGAIMMSLQQVNKPKCSSRSMHWKDWIFLKAKSLRSSAALDITCTVILFPMPWNDEQVSQPVNQYIASMILNCCNVSEHIFSTSFKVNTFQAA
jgi:dsRNA-specific ribonuclease